MSGTDNNIAFSNKDYLFSELGVNIDSGNPTFDPNSQQITINLQEYGTKNKYADNDDDFNINNDSNDNNDNDFVASKYKRKKQNIEAQIQQQQQYNGTKPIPTTNNRKVKKVVRANRKGNNRQTKHSLKNDLKQQITVDIGMSQVAEWAQHGTKVSANWDRDDFDEDVADDQVHTAEQQDIKRRIQDKLKKYESPAVTGHCRPQGDTLGSLKNKADQLRKQNEAKQYKMDTSQNQLRSAIADKYNEKIEQQQQQSQQEYRQTDETSNVNIHKNSVHDSSDKQGVKSLNIVNPPNLKSEKCESEQSDDHWQKINNNTLKTKQNTDKLMREHEQDSESVLNYYRNMKVDSNDDAMIGEQKQQEQPEIGFLQQLCGCLNFNNKKKSGGKQIQKRIIMISKIKLANTVEQMGLLKQIWTQITNKRFLRYGQHWNQIGFQNRDPATDLRGAGVLALVQWYGFILQHKDYQLKLHNFCIQFSIPLALTHIKVTSLVVSSINKGVIGGTQWKDYQQWYNAFVYYTFTYIMNNGRNLSQIGQLVEQAVGRTKNSMQKAKAEYISSICK